MGDIKETYLSFVAKCQNITTQSLTDENIPRIGLNHSSIDDYNAWYTIIESRPENIMFKSALREYQMSLLAGVLGLYNLAFTGLRFFFERTLTGVLFSTKEMELRLWMKGGRDTYWAEICDDDKGIFSHNFCVAFFPELKDEIKHFKVLATKVYRECSEYVHGNISTQSKVPDTLNYSDELIKEWNEKADTMKSILTFAFCLRYLPYLSEKEKKVVESCVLDQLSHVEPIRSYFSIVS